MKKHFITEFTTRRDGAGITFERVGTIDTIHLEPTEAERLNAASIEAAKAGAETVSFFLTSEDETPAPVEAVAA